MNKLIEAPRKFVPGFGPMPCDVMVIGEAPGADEAKQGKPFVGRAGKLLSEGLKAAGIKREELYITNCYKHRPPENRKPTKEEIESHRSYLLNEFDAVNPRFVLLLGNTALETWSNGKTKGISAWRMMDLSEDPSYEVYATYHPSAALHNPNYKEEIFLDLQKFARIIKN